MSSCGSGTRGADYDLPRHVGGLFIILIVSAGACALPITALRFPQLRIASSVHFGIRHFGTGVLIATALVHLFPTAFTSLVDPCLPPFFHEQYPALAGAIALAAVFMITTAEMIFSPGRSLCSTPATITADDPDGANMSANGGPSDERMSNSSRSDAITPAQNTPELGRSRSGRSHSFLRPVERQNSLPYTDAMQLTEVGSTSRALTSNERRPSSFDGLEDKEMEKQRHKLLMQCLLLECGILFHSVFIGLALAVAVGSEQVILLIAIAFHQTFEGLALGSRIAAVGWKPKAIQPWLMALAYGCTTPLGQAIGIATRNLYDPDSATGLVVVGTFNAFSAGLLVYTSLVDLLSEDFLSDHSWKTLRGNKRIVAMSLVCFGAFCMSLVGAWA